MCVYVCLHTQGSEEYIGAQIDHFVESEIWF